ncbi:TPA: hypothetical protein ACKQCJ_002497, partial [Stenotrophomonas maltophilia]
MDLFDGSNKASAYPVTCTYLPEWGYRQGCALHPLQAKATSTAEATAQAGFLRYGGVGPVAGDAVNPQ